MERSASHAGSEKMIFPKGIGYQDDPTAETMRALPGQRDFPDRICSRSWSYRNTGVPKTAGMIRLLAGINRHGPWETPITFAPHY
jgi:hypothetical protein